MTRREFIALLGGAAAARPIAARAQQGGRMRRLAWLDLLSENDPNAQARVKAFQQVTETLGWTVGRNLTIDFRWSLFDLAKARAAAAELLSLAPDLALCAGTTSTLTMQQATRTVPIVFAIVADPLAQGIVPSLAHPGGNTTGFAYLEPTVGGKWLGLLKEIASSLARVAFVFNPDSSPYSQLFLQSIEAAANRGSSPD